MTRKFYIENVLGERIPVNGESGIRLTNPAGLGMAMGAAYADLKKGFFANVSGDTEPQGEITCDLNFSGSAPYETYRAFVGWINQGYELFVVYNPYGDAEYYRKIDVNYITKTELLTARLLSCPASFACKSHWYRATPTRMTLTPESELYSWTRFPFTFEALFVASVSAGTSEVSASGHIPAAITFDYTGALENPEIILTGQTTGTVYGTCAITGTMAATDTLKYSSVYGDCYVKKVAADGTETDLIEENAVDIGHDAYFRVPLSEPCLLKIESGTAVTGNAIIKVYNYFRSV